MRRGRDDQRLLPVDNHEVKRSRSRLGVWDTKRGVRGTRRFTARTRGCRSAQIIAGPHSVQRGNRGISSAGYAVSRDCSSRPSSAAPLLLRCCSVLVSAEHTLRGTCLRHLDRP